VKRAVFLDRDGVINAAVVREGKPYPPASLAEVRILEDVPQALRLLKAAGLGLAVITNQPDVARGTQQREVVEAINSWLGSQLPLDRFEVCYHDEADACDCRKPKPGLIVRSAQALGVKVAMGFLVGDRWRDIDTGKAAGCRSVWIDRGYAEKRPCNHDYRATSLYEAAVWIVQQVRLTGEGK
jgi:D-glycero-D-manno-heptose 1,7-bisphosphate phosphatase